MKKHVNKNRSFDRLQYIMYDKKAREAMIYYLNNTLFIILTKLVRSSLSHRPFSLTTARYSFSLEYLFLRLRYVFFKFEEIV